MLSGENRPSVASPTTPAPAAGEAVAAPKELPNPPPAFGAEEAKLNPEADLNPEGAGGLFAVGAANEKDEAEGVEEGPNPDGGFVGAVKRLPNPVGWEDVDKEPNPVAGAWKLKVWAWAGAGAPNPLLPKPVVEVPNPLPAVEPKPLADDCGAVPFNSASKAARVDGFIIFSSWTLLFH